jgi:hypothetical protein
MLNDVDLEFFNQPTVRIRGVNVDFDCFIRQRFAVVLLLLKSGRKVGHHILIVGYAVHIYGRRLVFPRLLGAGGTLFSTKIKRPDISYAPLRQLDDVQLPS